MSWHHHGHLKCVVILEAAYMRIVDLGSTTSIKGLGRYEKVNSVVMLRPPMLTMMTESRSSVARPGVLQRITVSLLKKRESLIACPCNFADVFSGALLWVLSEFRMNNLLSAARLRDFGRSYWNMIWWLCLVPTSTTRFACDLGWRKGHKFNSVIQGKYVLWTMKPNSLT